MTIARNVVFDGPVDSSTVPTGSIQGTLLRRLDAHAVPVLVCASLLLTVASLVSYARSDVLGFDFRGTLWEPGRAILASESPYPPADPEAIRTGNPAVYPPAVMLVVAPLTLLPWSVGLGVWLGLSVLAAVAAFRLLGISDPRLLVVALGSPPVLLGLIHGNLAVMLLLGLAVAWRWRDRPRVAGGSVAALIVAKLFLWPLIVWLVATRRLRAAAYAAAYSVAALLVSWAIIGFDGFREYPHLLAALDHVYTRHTQSLAALGLRLGLSESAAKLVALGVAALVLTIGIRLAKARDGDRRMYAAAVIAAIVASPIAWLYYYLLLLVPLVLCRPVVARAWWIVGAFWPLMIASGYLTTSPPCCPPPGMPEQAWATLTTEQPLLLVLGPVLLSAATAWVVLRSPAQAPRAGGRAA